LRNSGESNTHSRNEECSAGYAPISQIKIYYGFAVEGVVALGVAIMDSPGRPLRWVRLIVESKKQGPEVQEKNHEKIGKPNRKRTTARFRGHHLTVFARLGKRGKATSIEWCGVSPRICFTRLRSPRAKRWEWLLSAQKRIAWRHSKINNAIPETIELVRCPFFHDVSGTGVRQGPFNLGSVRQAPLANAILTE